MDKNAVINDINTGRFVNPDYFIDALFFS